MSLRTLALGTAAILLGTATIVALLAPYIPPDQFWGPLFAAYGFLYLVAAMILLTAIWCLRPTRGILIPLIILLFCIPFLGRHFRLGLPPSGPDGNSIHIGTLNTHSLRLLSGYTKGHLRMDTEKALSAYPDFLPPDILCLQEVPRAYDPVAADWGMKGAGTHRYRNTLLFSRYPIVHRGQKEFDGSGNSIIWADIETPEGKIRIYNAHLQSHSISPQTEQLLDQRIDDRQTWKGYKNILGRVRHFTRMRASQARWLADHVAQCPWPVVVAGDLNDTPQSYSYRVLAQRLSDSFRNAGQGFGTTFAGKIPGLRIDYILGGDGVHFLSHKVHRVRISDHYPVFAKFVLSPTSR